MTKIYLIRHAEAEGNLYRRAQGQYDSNLTMLGRRQVAALAERFRYTALDGLWASDLNRTQSTASALLKYHPLLTLHPDPALREVDVGVWEDRPWGDIRREEPEQLDWFNHDPARWHVPGGESYDGLCRRIETALLELADAYPRKTLAVVSHAFAIRALVSRLTGVPFAQLPFGDNTAVTTLTAEDGALRVDSYADASHLGELSTFARQGLDKDHLAPKADGYYEPLRLPAEQEYYEHAYSDAWMVSHGDLKGYAPVLYLQAAAAHAAADPQCLVKLLYDGAPVGLVELDPDRGREELAGWISLLWVDGGMRGRRFGSQLVGHAVSHFRRQGRETLRLHVSRTNETALRFYEAMGFYPKQKVRGVGGPLYMMEMDISQRVWRLL